MKEYLNSHFLKIPSDLEIINHAAFNGHKFYIKRDDSINPLISGNKWRKLQSIISDYNPTLKEGIVTFGGAFSNHLVATAVSCKIANIPSAAFIRTDKIDLENPTLKICLKYDMELLSMDRKLYALKNDHDVIQEIRNYFPNRIIIPEGGFMSSALIGIENGINELKLQLGHTPNYIACALGTSTTVCGLLYSLPKTTEILAFPAIKGYNKTELKKNYLSLTKKSLNSENFSILYHEKDKAYAKKDLELFLFAENFLNDTGILLDPIYTSKAMRGLFNTAEMLKKNTSIVFLHTGGIQAWNGYFYRFPNLKIHIPLIYKYMEDFNIKINT